jgi:hypothetical protein
MRSCNEHTTIHCVESYLYYVILVNKKIFSEEWNEWEKKIDNIIIYIVENIKFIYTSFDEFFLPVSQRVEMNYIFSDNVCILYLSCYFKSPKETVNLSKKSKNKHCSNRFLVVSSVKSALISINAVTVSYRRSTWIRYQEKISHFWDRPVPIFSDVRFSYLALVQDKKITCVLPANACCTVYVNSSPNSPCFSFLK